MRLINNRHKLIIDFFITNAELESSNQLGNRKLKNLNFILNPQQDTSLTPESLSRLNILIKENPGSHSKLILNS